MQKVYIKTFGCQSNYADSEQMAGILTKNNFEIVDSLEKSDIVILNSCGVKGITQNRVLSYISAVPKQKRLYVGGCLPKIHKINNVSGVFDTNSVTKIVDIIKNNKGLFSDEKEYRISCPRIRKDRKTAIINIAQGCLNSCSFCGTKSARGKLMSYKPKDIAKEVKAAVADGCSRIYLCSQDNGCYGFDISTNLPALLRTLVSIKGGFRIRVGMANPQHVKNYLPELIEVYKSPKIMKFLHIPVQSGSDKVLREMRRGHTVNDVKNIVTNFRKNFPDITISTDVIVGYPTESKEDFGETVALIKEVKPEVLNISKFAPRPGTAAAKLKQLRSQEVKRRSVIIHRLKNWQYAQRQKRKASSNCNSSAF